MLSVLVFTTDIETVFNHSYSCSILFKMITMITKRNALRHANSFTKMSNFHWARQLQYLLYLVRCPSLHTFTHGYYQFGLIAFPADFKPTQFMSNENKMGRNCSKNVELFYYSFYHSAGNSRSECCKTQFPVPLNTLCNMFGKVCVINLLS